MTEEQPVKKTDLAVGLYIQRDKVLYVKAPKGYYFPSIKIEHNTPEEYKKEQLKAYFHKALNIDLESIEAVAHIQKDPRDMLQYFIDSHIFLYNIVISPGVSIKSTGTIELDFLDLDGGLEKLFTFKSKFIIEFIKAWKAKSYQKLDSKSIWEWYNKWKKENILKKYKKYVDEEIEECRAGAGRLETEIDLLSKQYKDNKDNELGRKLDSILKESEELAKLMSKTAESIELSVCETEVKVNQESPDLQISVLETIKNNLCNKLYNLNKSHLTGIEKRIAYRLMGHLLKKTTDLLDNYSKQGAMTEYDRELKKLVYELESENLSPFERRN
jgi:hypothetical protein